MDDIHVTDLFAALVGKTVVVSAFVVPVVIEKAVDDNVIDETGTRMVITHDAENPPFRQVTLIVAVPGETAVTTPDEFTVALDDVDVHTTD